MMVDSMHMCGCRDIKMRYKPTGGDRVDGRLDDPSWSHPTRPKQDGWEPVGVYPLPGRALSMDVAEPTQRRDTIAPKSLTWVNHSGTPVLVVEMAEVFTGWTVVSGMRGPPGGQVTIAQSALPFKKGDYTAQYNMQHEYLCYLPTLAADLLPQ